MRAFDRAFVDDTRAALATLEEDQVPEWGQMRPPQLFAHLKTAVAYSLGKEEETPSEGGFLGRHIVGPLLLNEILPMPKNVKAPKMYDAAMPSATLDEFMEELEAFLGAYESNTLPDIAHPYFGAFGAEGWAKLHVLHVKHHSKQFGLS